MQRWAVLLILLTAGCDPLAPRTNVVETRYYTVVPDIEVTTFPTVLLTVGVRRLDYARVYKEPMVYREAPHEVKLYDFDEWTELPATTMTRALIDALTKSRRFNDVGDAVEMRAPDLALTGELRAFEEVRTIDPPYASVEVRLSLRRALGAAEDRAVWSKILSAEVPLPRDNRAGLAEAMSEAVAQIAEQAATEIGEIAIRPEQGVK